ncbi:hypothetical protein C8J57DRAFT_1537377 [Mycena rebaudengoi]|nr:hypothetical protein C8J57DRAFT_1537377 [Mycena rebaudengoi]
MAHTSQRGPFVSNIFSIPSRGLCELYTIYHGSRPTRAAMRKGKTRGRVDAVFGDTAAKVLVLFCSSPSKRTNTSPAPAPYEAFTVRALPTTPTLEQQGSVRSNLQGSVRGQAPDTQMQMHLPGEPDCTFELVEVPSVRGIRDLPPPPQTHTTTSRCAPPPSAWAPRFPRNRSFLRTNSRSQRSLNAGTQLLGASNPYAQLHRAERYE